MKNTKFNWKIFFATLGEQYKGTNREITIK